MLINNIRFIVLVFLFPAFLQAEPIDFKLILEDGKNVEQISGIVKYGSYYLLIPQKEQKVYSFKFEDLNKLIDTGGELLLKSHKIAGVKVQRLLHNDGAGWESIKVKENSDGIATLYLLYEGSQDEHGLYTATINTEGGELKFSNLKKSKKFTCKGCGNYAYETILIDKDEILLIPEKEAPKVIRIDMSENDENDGNYSVYNKKFRLSDAVVIEKNSKRAIGTSFCFKSKSGENECDEKVDSTESHLLCLAFDSSKVEVIDMKVLDHKLKNQENSKIGSFNVEGVAFLEDGLIIVNDNDPGNDTSTLRLLNDEVTVNFINKCKNGSESPRADNKESDVGK